MTADPHTPPLVCILRWLGCLSFYAYAAALVALGAAGLLAPRWELATLYGCDTSAWTGADSLTLFHQYRFLKALVAVTGLIAFCWRKQILQQRGPNLAFVALILAGVLGRGVSVAGDGLPHPKLIAFGVSEAAFAALILLHQRLAAPPETSPTTTA